MIAAKIFSNCSDPMETTLQVLLSRDRLKFSLDDRGQLSEASLGFRSDQSDRSDFNEIENRQ